MNVERSNFCIELIERMLVKCYQRLEKPKLVEVSKLASEYLGREINTGIGNVWDAPIGVDGGYLMGVKIRICAGDGFIVHLVTEADGHMVKLWIPPEDEE